MSSIVKPTPVFDRDDCFVYLRQCRTASRSILAAMGDRAVEYHDRRRLWNRLNRNVHRRSDLFRFTIVRNPYSRALSQWRFLILRRRIPKVPFEKFTTEWLPKGCRLNYHLHSQSEFAAGADFIGRFERLAEDWKIISRMCGLNCDLEFNEEHRSSPPGDWRDGYTVKAYKQVSRIYRLDIEKFGYEFSL